MPVEESNVRADPALLSLWEKFCGELSTRLGPEPVRTWFHPLQPLRLDPIAERFVIGVPGAFHLDWLHSHYSETIDECSSKLLGSGYETEFEIVNGWTRPAPTEPEESVKAMPLPVLSKRHASPLSLKIDPDFCFETFVAGEASRFARSAAMAVALSPGGNRFNPLLIHGGVGLGKTHLLHAIANQAIANNPACCPILTTSEQFTSDFIRAVQRDKKIDFAEQYADADLLLVDDVQFFMGREQTQRQFFHTFNTLINSGKQIVMTSDRSPRELDSLDERLRSRFAQGLVVEVSPPEYETRVAILRVWAERDGVKLPGDVEEFLATHITSNVRNLRGAVIRLLAIASFEQSDLTVAIARKTLHDLLSRPHSVVTIDRLMDIVAKHYGLSTDLFATKSRKQPLAEARMIVMALAYELTGQSLSAIGTRLGGRDHTTVLHARESIRERSEHDSDFRKLLEDFKRDAEHGITV